MNLSFGHIILGKGLEEQYRVESPGHCMAKFKCLQLWG